MGNYKKMSCCADDGCGDAAKKNLDDIELTESESEEEVQEDHDDVVKFKTKYETREKELNSVLAFLQ